MPNVIDLESYDPPADAWPESPGEVGLLLGGQAYTLTAASARELSAALAHAAIESEKEVTFVPAARPDVTYLEVVILPGDNGQ